MDIFQTIISHYPKWSKIELITVIIVMIISFIILERYYKKNKITKTQMCFSILFVIYLLHVYGSTVFSRLPSTRKYQLEVFWSWKEIIHPIGRLGTASRYDLFLENILNIVMLLPIGIFLPLAYGKKMDWKIGLLIGISISFSIELLQLVLCRGLFEFDDIIHNSLGFLMGILINNRILRKSCK